MTSSVCICSDTTQHKAAMNCIPIILAGFRSQPHAINSNKPLKMRAAANMGRQSFQNYNRSEDKVLTLHRATAEQTRHPMWPPQCPNH